MSDTDTDEPSLELYEWLDELGWRASRVPSTDDEREEATARAREIISDVMTVLTDAAVHRLEHSGTGIGKVTMDDLADLERHMIDVGPRLGFPYAGTGVRVMIERGEAEIAIVGALN